MTLCVPEAANQSSLHLETNDKKRSLYMIRSRVDMFGNLHEENRTTFHQPEWLKLSKKRWIQKRNYLADKFAETMEQAARETGNKIYRTELETVIHE